MDHNEYCNWLIQVNQIERRKRKQANISAAVLSAAMLVLLEATKKRKVSSKKRVWVDEVFQQRQFHGFYNYIFPVIQKGEARFHNYFRMSGTQFEDLLCIVSSSIYKQYHIREPVSPAERLCITLRYLASGDIMTSMQYNYLRGLTTISNIIKETCTAIWNSLHKIVLPSSFKPKDWLEIAKGFEDLWNFPHCIGAIDGKHIVLQCPDNAGSSFYNYKGSHSIVLMAICDANYKFLFVDIGAFGRGSDSSSFRCSAFGQKFQRNQMNLPKPTPITVEGSDIPYFLVGDEAFPLTNYLLRPYPGRSLTPERRIYNYRLSRARRTIENTFGIMASQWRIFRRPIDSSLPVAEKIVQAAVCLHNWLRMEDNTDTEYVTPTMIDSDDNGKIIPGSWEAIADDWAFQDITQSGTNGGSRFAYAIRDEYCVYLNSEGAVPWQY